MAFFTNQLLKWYTLNKRNLPWRKTSDPYKIWVSEIILQQTRIDQGTDYYLNFIRTFPDVRSLAKAPVEKVLKLWQGLGYYSRARNLHHTAKDIVNTYKGVFPDTYEDIIKFKGIGDYTAGAILSIAFNKPYPVVDGNVIRVISRIFGITKPVGDTSATKEIRVLAEKMMPYDHPGDYNQALMEFGALQCKPQNPLCSNCPLKSICFALRKKMVDKIPVKKPDTQVKNRFLNYFLIYYSSNKTTTVYLRNRTGNDIWKNMYDLPCIETKRKTSLNLIQKSKDWSELFGNHEVLIENPSKTYIHKLSHQSIHAVFYKIRISQALKKTGFLKLVTIKRLHTFPVPRLIEKYLVSQKLLK
jgi:A/G-specific adenine glycosylase